MNIIRFLARGAAHEKLGCQDYASKYVGEDRFVLAVADGCSSSKYAAKAAKANCSAAIDYFKNKTLTDFLSLTLKQQQNEIRAACEAAVSKLARQSKGKNHPKDYCATLVFAVSDYEQLLIGHIGDGSCYVIDKNGELIYHSAPENGEASNLTYFSLSDSGKFRLTTLPFYNVRDIFMSSDGTANLRSNYCDEQGNDAVAIIAEKIGSGEIHNACSLSKELLSFVRAGIEVSDDWSLLYCTLNQQQCTDVSDEPYTLTELRNAYFDNCYEEYYCRKNKGKAAQDTTKLQNASETETVPKPPIKEDKEPLAPPMPHISTNQQSNNNSEAQREMQKKVSTDELKGIDQNDELAVTLVQNRNKKTFTKEKKPRKRILLIKLWFKIKSALIFNDN